MEVSRQLHAPAALLLGRKSQCQLDRRLTGPHSGSGRYGFKRKSLVLVGNRTPGVQPLTPRSTEDTDFSERTTSG
jgi:hypothetical protein